MPFLCLNQNTEKTHYYCFAILKIQSCVLENNFQVLATFCGETN